MSYIQKLPHAKLLDLKQEIPVAKDQISSRTLVTRPSLGLTLFSLDNQQEISSHASTGDAFVQILSGVAEITIAKESFIVAAGESLIMPANTPHALKAIEAFQMLLLVVKPENREE